MYNRKKVVTAALATLTIGSLLPAAAFAAPPTKPGWQGQRPDTTRGRSDTDWNRDRDHDDSRDRDDDRDRWYKHDKKDKHGNRGRTDNTWNRGRNKDDDDWRDDHHGNRGRTDNTWNKGRDQDHDRDRDDRDWRDNHDSGWNQNSRYELSSLANSVTSGGYNLIRNDSAIVFSGTSGSLYSLRQYQMDRGSSNTTARVRADIFSHSYFTRNGQRYERRLVSRNGTQYYQFVRA